MPATRRSAADRRRAAICSSCRGATARCSAPGNPIARAIRTTRRVTESDVAAFIAELNQAFPGARSDAGRHHARPSRRRAGGGARRPRQRSRGTNRSAITPAAGLRGAAQRRRHQVHDGARRRRARHRPGAVEAAAAAGRRAGPPTTPLPGGSMRDIGLAIADARREHDEGLPTDTIPHLIAAYGSRYRDVMELAADRPDWRTRIGAGFAGDRRGAGAGGAQGNGADAGRRGDPADAARRARLSGRRRRSRARRRSSAASWDGRRSGSGRDRGVRSSIGCVGRPTGRRLAQPRLRHRERVEDVGEAGREPDRRIDRRQAERTAARRNAPGPACSARRVSAGRGSRSPETAAAPRRHAAVHLADELGLLRHRPRERQAVSQDVVLPVADVGSARMPTPRLPTTRIDCTVLAPSSDTKKSVVSRPRPLSFDAFGSFVANRMPIAGRLAASGRIRIFVAIDDVLDVVRAVAGDRQQVTTAAPRSRLVICRVVVRSRRRSAARRSS